MTQNSITKSPRLYTPLSLKSEQSITLSQEQAHYLKNVLRKNVGDGIRLFNGIDGEWHCRLENVGKKSAEALPESQIRPQAHQTRRIHAFFAPIKKQRMDILIEKAVELGVTDLHPMLTQNTEIRKLNEERIRAQIIEASEQCERLDVPSLYPLEDMIKAISHYKNPIFAALERGEHPNARDILTEMQNNIAILTGPEGGFTSDEINQLTNTDFIRPVSLGENILRTETAVIKLLALI
jgi:16S rRNA (uracil1498-N3)-methyltransferase